MKIKSFQGGYDKNLCYVLSCESTKLCALVDPSVEILPVVEYIENNNLVLDKILVTHTHHDHIAFLYDFHFLFPNIQILVYSRIKGNY